MADSDHPFAQEGCELMGATFEVHNVLGGGLSEEIYQQSLEIEFSLRDIPFQAKRQLKVFYKERQLDRAYVPDFLVYGHIVVELKAVSQLASEHEAQLLNYMRISRQPIGYLINFAPLGKLDYKRFILSEFV